MTAGGVPVPADPAEAVTMTERLASGEADVAAFAAWLRVLTG